MSTMNVWLSGAWEEKEGQDCTGLTPPFQTRQGTGVREEGSGVLMHGPPVGGRGGGASSHHQRVWGVLHEHLCDTSVLQRATPGCRFGRRMCGVRALDLSAHAGWAAPVGLDMTPSLGLRPLLCRGKIVS